ncbi:MAG: fumarylacetoacetate hydrolase family protein [Rhodospirillales bacterium]|jgi:acylpyruvate hydrolase
MRLVTFLEGGVEKIGVRNGENIVDVTEAAKAFGGDMIGVIKGGTAAKDALKAAAANGQARPLSSIKLLPPIPRPGKILCIGRNYAAHAAEGGAAPPTYPEVFVRFPASLIAHGDPLILPKASDKFDFEGELVMVIAKTGRHVSEANALDMIYGWSLFNDGSVRDYQRKASQWTMGKNFDGTGAFGPDIVTADEVTPGGVGLQLQTRVSGETMQNANTRDLIFPIAKLIWHLTEVMTLEAGDIVVTGTPEGVGYARNPPRFMVPGDTVDIEVEQVGILSNPVVAE